MSIFPDVKQIIDWEYIPRYGYYILNYNKSSVSCDGDGSIQIINVSFGNVAGAQRTLNCPGVYTSIDGNPINNIEQIKNNSGTPVVYYSSSSTPSIQFSPVVNNLKDSVDEFIPYVVYVSLGVLGVLIGFVAIRWLILRIRSKVFNSFNK